MILNSVRKKGEGTSMLNRGQLYERSHTVVEFAELIAIFLLLFTYSI